ncbi:MAG: hypothetical protein ACR2MP_13565 [Streptosporangiaceae bacterium]
MARIRGGKRERRQLVRIGAPDAALTANGGLAAVSELCDRLGVIGAIDAAAGPIKARSRGYSAGELLAGIAAAQLAGEDFLTGLDRHRADGGPVAHAGARIVVHDRRWAGPPDHARSVGGRRDRRRGGDGADGGAAAAGAGRGAG